MDRHEIESTIRHLQETLQRKKTLADGVTRTLNSLYKQYTTTSVVDFTELDRLKELIARQEGESEEVNTAIAELEGRIANLQKKLLEPSQAAPLATPKLTKGWRYIDEILEDARNSEPLTDAELRDFFNASRLTWRHIVSEKIAPRNAVSKIVDKLNAKRALGLRIYHILSESGEGKSTVLRQVVYQLSQAPGWKIIWRESLDPNLKIDFLDRIEKTSTPVTLIVIDDADQLAKELFQTARELKGKEPRNIQFLICSLIIDWEMVNRDKELANPLWGDYGYQEPFEIGPLEEDEAGRIYDSWKSCDDAASGEILGKLSDLDRAAAIKQFLAASLDKGRKRSLLGAILKVRTGKDPEEHVAGLLQTLQTNSRQMLEAYTYIALLDSVNFKLLNPTLLATVLGLENRLDIFEQQIIGPLLASGEIVDFARDSKSLESIYVIRHRTIAIVAIKQLLRSPYYKNEDTLYEKLVACDVKLSLRHIQNEESHERHKSRMTVWYKLCDAFVRKNKHARAMGLTRTMSEADPTDSFHVVEYAKFTRAAGKDPTPIFRKAVSRRELVKTRGFYQDWAVSEAQIGNYVGAICLGALALADAADDFPLLAAQAKMTLNSMADNLNRLKNFEACAVAAQVGLKVDIVPGKTHRTHADLHRLWGETNTSIGNVSDERAYQLLVEKIRTFWTSKNNIPEVQSLITRYSPPAFTQLHNLIR
ncbi:MAG: hypothetical protein IT324_32030 [Anaerolineae bacterium]|nr:hypothetical protein [Anaerolineae bacterium]